MGDKIRTPKSEISGYKELSSKQHSIVRMLSKGSFRLDPSQNPAALGEWDHLIQEVDVQQLRQLSLRRAFW